MPVAAIPALAIGLAAAGAGAGAASAGGKGGGGAGPAGASLPSLSQVTTAIPPSPMAFTRRM